MYQRVKAPAPARHGGADRLLASLPPRRLLHEAERRGFPDRDGAESTPRPPPTLAVGGFPSTHHLFTARMRRAASMRAWIWHPPGPRRRVRCRVPRRAAGRLAISSPSSPSSPSSHPPTLPPGRRQSKTKKKQTRQPARFHGLPRGAARNRRLVLSCSDVGSAHNVVLRPSKQTPTDRLMQRAALPHARVAESFPDAWLRPGKRFHFPHPLAASLVCRPRWNKPGHRLKPSPRRQGLLRPAQSSPRPRPRRSDQPAVLVDFFLLQPPAHLHVTTERAIAIASGSRIVVALPLSGMACQSPSAGP